MAMENVNNQGDLKGVDVGETVRVEVKSVYSSKTLWFNVLTTLAAILVAISNQQWIMDYPQALPIIVSLQGIINFVLRFITVAPLKLEPPVNTG